MYDTEHVNRSLVYMYMNTRHKKLIVSVLVSPVVHTTTPRFTDYNTQTLALGRLINLYKHVIVVR